jgi:hypothetical protein
MCKYKLLIFIFLNLFCWGIISAQTQKMQDVVYLHDGSILKGQVLEFQPEGKIKIEIVGGSILVYPASAVKELRKETITVLEHLHLPAKPSTSLPLKTKGLYSVSQVHANFGKDYNYQTQVGTGISQTVGYQFNQWIGLGLGAGFSSIGNKSFVPIFSEARGYFSKDVSGFFYSLAAGYAYAFKHSADQFGFSNSNTKAKGGLWVYPAIGYRFKSSKKMNACLDLGYCIQKASYEYNSPDWTGNPNIYTEDNTWKRLTLRFGILF